MRIISGKYNRRIIKHVNNNTTRETQDKIRGAIFNSFMPYFDEGIALDLFSGSGAMGLECLSRGAKYCYFVDNSKEAIATIKDNMYTLDIKNEAKILFLDYKIALNDLKSNKFDVIFLDPPYNLDIINDIIDYVLENNMLNQGGIIVAEYEKEVNNHGLSVLKEKNFGYKKIKILLKEF